MMSGIGLMTDKQHPTRHNYHQRMVRLMESGKVQPGQLAKLEISHDDWCKIFTGGYCNCHPDLRLNGKAV